MVFHELEDKLHDAFCEQRLEGWKVGGRWLKAKMKLLSYQIIIARIYQCVLQEKGSGILP